MGLGFRRFGSGNATVISGGFTAGRRGSIPESGRWTGHEPLSRPLPPGPWRPAAFSAGVGAGSRDPVRRLSASPDAAATAAVAASGLDPVRR